MEGEPITRFPPRANGSFPKISRPTVIGGGNPVIIAEYQGTQLRRVCLFFHFNSDLLTNFLGSFMILNFKFDFGSGAAGICLKNSKYFFGNFKKSRSSRGLCQEVSKELLPQLSRRSVSKELRSRRGKNSDTKQLRI